MATAAVKGDAKAASTAAAAPTSQQQQQQRSFVHCLLAGGFAGTAVDVTLFPLDTIKTRMQSQNGFLAAGGFRGLSTGLQSAALGSAPSAALFFTTYEQIKHMLKPYTASAATVTTATTTATTAAAATSSLLLPVSVTHCIAASVAESMACLVRVPTENVKQKMQIGLHKTMSATIHSILNSSSNSSSSSSSSSSRAGIRGLYIGYGTTLMREIPFSVIQFPLYEYGKQQLAAAQQQQQCSPLQSAAIGSVCGGFAAAVTTPIDVAKTRMMLNQTHVANASLLAVLQQLHTQRGVAGLFAGVQPRVAWISIGGFVFFGAYETGQTVLNSVQTVL